MMVQFNYVTHISLLQHLLYTFCMALQTCAWNQKCVCVRLRQQHMLLNSGTAVQHVGQGQPSPSQEGKTEERLVCSYAH